MLAAAEALALEDKGRHAKDADCLGGAANILEFTSTLPG
jgi:hypothetical protein